MKEDYLFECLREFDDLPDQVQEVFGSYDSCLRIKKIEEAYNVSLSFAVILVAIGELAVNDLPQYLALKFALPSDKAEEITAQLDQEIFSRAVDLSLTALPEDTASDNTNSVFGSIMDLSLEDKRELILKTFEKQLLAALSAAPDQLKTFNIAIFQVFNADEIMEDKVETLFYNNQEKIGDHQIILDGHPASPSVSNWLKDFIKKYGSDVFNEVILAEYLSQSPNVRQLKPADKELVRKLLKLYYNLVFFPESMSDVPLDDWEVFPIDKQYKMSEKPQVVAKETASENKSAVTAENLALKTGAAAGAMTDRQKIIFDLQKNLAKYPSSSLEYKAVRQEINRLTRQ